VHPVELVTVKVYVPSVKSEMTVLSPLPLLVILPGEILRVHVPAGKSLSATLPVDTLHEGCVMIPIDGVAGTAFTTNVYVATAAEHGDPDGLFVVKVIITVLPASPASGVYVNEKGDVVADEGLTEPEPLSVIVKAVALPPKVLPPTVTNVVPQVLPLLPLSEIVGGFTHPHDTEKPTPSVMHPAEFLTVIL
jgi:hypothetical protein